MPEAADQYTSSKWPQVRQFLETAFLSRTRDEWEQVFLKTDACVAPVLQPSEVLRQKGSPIPHPAPHLSRTPAKAPKPHVQSQIVTAGDHTLSVLQELGLSTEEIQRLENTRDVEIKRRADSKL